MRIAKQVRLGALLVGVALSAVVMFALGHSQAGTSQAADHGAMAVDCNYDPAVPPEGEDVDPSTDAGVQTECTYAPGSTFDIAVHVTVPPADGYFQVQAKVGWTEGVVNYLPESVSDEALWDECTIVAGLNNWETLGVPSVFIACSPLPNLVEGETSTGAVFTFTFQCKSAPEIVGSPPAGLDTNQAALELIAGADEVPPEPAQGGTIFLDAFLQPIVPDLTGAVVTCAEVDEPDPTATPVPTDGGDEGVNLTKGDTIIDVGESTELTFTVTDDAGNTVEGVDCTFSIVGPDGTDASLSSAAGTTDANGDVSVTLTAGTTAETVQVEADCGDFGSFVQDVTVSPALPSTGAELAADGGFSVGLWAMIGGLLVAAAAGLTVFGWRSTRAR